MMVYEIIPIELGRISSPYINNQVFSLLKSLDLDHKADYFHRGILGGWLICHKMNLTDQTLGCPRNSVLG